MADGPAKKLIAIVKPPKPVSEMTDAELDAFADQIFETAAGAQPDAPKPSA